MLKSLMSRINRLAATMVTTAPTPCVIFEYPDGHIEHRESGRSWPTLAEAEAAIELPPVAAPAVDDWPRLIHITFVKPMPQP